VEVKIGVSQAPRELSFESTQTQEDVQAAIEAALTGASPVLSLQDDRGRRYVVPSERIAYVEIGEAVERRVGFTTV
jgi:hypothetical protein